MTEWKLDPPKEVKYPNIPEEFRAGSGEIMGSKVGLMLDWLFWENAQIRKALVALQKKEKNHNP